MSADRGRAEVISARSERRDCATTDVAYGRARSIVNVGVAFHLQSVRVRASDHACPQEAPCDAGSRQLCCACGCDVAGHSACGGQGVGRVAYLYASMRGPYKKIDVALGDRMR
jgi:hypothetical protein